MCTPAIRAFKETYPECNIDFLTELPETLEGNPHIARIYAVDRRREYNVPYQYGLIREIRNQKYDLVVDFFANPRSAYYAFFSRAPVRLSYGYGHRRWAYNLTPRKAPEEVYAAVDRLNLLRAIGVHIDDFRLEFYFAHHHRDFARRALSEAHGKPIFSISPVSRRKFNRWPLENYARLGDMIAHEFGAATVILVGPGEEESANRIAAMMEATPIIPRISYLGQLGAIFSRVAFHVGNDNGPKHIAVACGAPSLTIYGPHSHISWTYPDPSRHFYITPREYCEECRLGSHRKKTECIGLIPVEDVMASIRSAAALSDPIARP
jgi:ADP-heptose:LPS heptosyltransferase